MSNPNETFKQASAFPPGCKARIGSIRSSNGVITIDLSTGAVRAVYGEIAWTKHIKMIARFDLAEYREFYRDGGGKDTSFDILDIGYWTVDGEYVPPSAAFRKDITIDKPEVLDVSNEEIA
jgi:hypothetical protein